MEEKTAVLDGVIHCLQNGNADYSTEICGADDYKILISLNNVVFCGDITGNYNAVVGIGNVTNNGTNNGYMVSNYTAADIGMLNTCSLSDQQRILLEAYDRLDTIGQARLVTYADKLCRKAVTA